MQALRVRHSEAKGAGECFSCGRICHLKGCVVILPDALCFGANRSTLAMKNLTTPLSDAELDRLGGFFTRVVGGDIANVEAFDGFITALAVCPELIAPSEFLPVLKSGASDDGHLVFDDMGEADEFMGLVMRHWNTVNATLGRDEPHLAILLENEDGVSLCNDWAQGFHRATQLRPALWSKILEDDARGGGMIPILALAFEHHPDPDMRPYKEPITTEQRDNLRVGMIAGALQLYRAFAPERRALAGAAGLGTIRRPKVGRNDPCPCGSGKKFKKCCGSVILH